MARRGRLHREKQVVVAIGIVYALAVVTGFVAAAVAFIKLITH